MYQNLQIFTSTIVAVFLEASPFLLFGALVSSVFEICLPPNLLEKYLPKNRFLGLLFGMGAGMLVPTCDCGALFIARRLLKKNVPAHVAMTYMFSAPVINPLVLAATYVAFRGNIWVVLARVVTVAACACCMGMVIGEINPALLLRKEKDSAELANCQHDDCGGSTCPDRTLHALPVASHAGGCGYVADKESRVVRVLLHAASEFLDMGKYLVLGALVVGFFKVLMVEEMLLSFQGNLFLAVGLMMLLAVLLCICSEADAFVAASFSSFPGAAQLSFMSLGPMVDLKLIFMYCSVFRKRIVLILFFLPTILIFGLSLLLGPMMR